MARSRRAQPRLPSGLVTFLMTDIEGSTRLFWQRGDAYAGLLDTHHGLLAAAFEDHGGVEVATEGDALVVAFPDAAQSLRACVAGQLALASHVWPEGAAIRVRMGLDTAEAEPVGNDYVSLGLHRAARICAGAHGGQILVSEATAAAVRTRLPAGIDLIPLGSFHLRGFDEPTRIHQVTSPALPTQFPPLRVQGVVHHNLPFSRSAFVGRGAERVALADKARRTGIVTVTGVGGVGKTRLAISVAFDLLDEFEDGVWLVDLSSARGRRGVVGAAAAALALREAPGSDLEEVVLGHLSTRSALLLLDSCEHVLEPAAAFVEDLTRRAPRVVVVATSREPLQIEGEAVFRLDPLPVPEPGVTSAVLTRDAEAVRLFEERAVLADADFRVTDANADTVGAIVRQLDGIPLAIELAAAALTDRSLAGVLDGLADRFTLLTDGRRTAPARHHTLRAALEWSLDLLDGDERVLFARLGAFARTGTVEAAREVCGGPPLHDADVEKLIRRLARASLLTLAGGERWTMLGSVHELAVAELAGMGGAAETAARHRDHVCRRVEALAPRIGLRGSGAMAEIAADLGNVLQALATGAAAGGADLTVRLAAAMGPFWTTHGDWGAGVQHLRDALALEGATDGARAKALAALGNLMLLRGDIARAEGVLREAEAVATASGDQTTLARAATGLGYVAFRRSDLVEAEHRWRGALEGAERAGDERVSAGILRSLAIAAGSRGDQAEAGRLLDRGIAAAEHARDDQLLRLLLGSKGEIDLWTGRYREAWGRYGQALDVASEIGDLSARPLLLCEMGWVALLTGDLATAERLASEAAELAEDLGNRRTLASALRLRAESLIRRARFDVAAEDLARAHEVAEGLGAPAELAGVLCTQAYAALEQLQLADARRLAGAALEQSALGHAMREVFPQWILGVAALESGDPDQADRDFLTVVEHHFAESAPRHLANSRWGMACARAAIGRPREAAGLHRDALTMRNGIGDRLGVVDSLAAIAALVGARDPDTAVALARAAGSLRRACGAELTPRQGVADAAFAALVRGTAPVAPAGAEPGEPLGPDAAVELALRVLGAMEGGARVPGT